MARKKLQSQQPTVLITGATDGIGLALARRYQAANATLILVGRRPLRELDPALFNPGNYCQVDLAAVDAADRIAVWLECADLRRLDQVYLNAGTSYVGDLSDHAPHAIEQMVRVNLWTPMALVHRLAPLVAPQHGQFIFVSAATAAMPTPDYAVYTATKAALEGFVRSLRMELRAQHSPIRVTLVRPGATYTGLHAKSGADPARMDWTRFPSAEQTAAALHRAAMRNRRTANLGAANSLLHWIGRNASGVVTAALRRRLPPPPTPMLAPPALKPHIAIIGGATSIAAALAQTFATDASTITLIDSDAAATQATATALHSTGAQVNVAQADLSTLAGCSIALDALAAGPPISVFINALAIRSEGPFLSANLDSQERILAANLTAPMLLTAGLLRDRRLAPGASLIFLSSLTHFAGCPGAAVYAAAQDGMASLAKSLAATARPSARHVLTVYTSDADSHRQTAPHAIAATVQRAVARRRSRVIPGPANQLAVAFAHLCPPFAESILARTYVAQLAAPTAAPDTNPRTPL